MRRTAVFFVLATAAAVEAADTGAPFGPPSRFDIGASRSPTSVAAGDVNGDGFTDVATADYGSSDLTVAFGGPDGLSSTRTHRVPVPDKPERVLLVDVNGDHRADAVATSSEGHDVIVLLAN